MQRMIFTSSFHAAITTDTSGSELTTSCKRLRISRRFASGNCSSVSYFNNSVFIQPGFLKILIPERLFYWRVQGFRSFQIPGRSTDRKSTRLNSSHVKISYAVFCLKKKKKKINNIELIYS